MTFLRQRCEPESGGRERVRMSPSPVASCRSSWSDARARYHAVHAAQRVATGSFTLDESDVSTAFPHRVQRLSDGMEHLSAMEHRL